MWGITSSHMDNAVLSYLNVKPHPVQQHILLTLSAVDLRKVNNLSAFVSRLIHDLEMSQPLCLGFLAGCCEDQCCKFLHPVTTTGWKVLWERWQVDPVSSRLIPSEYFVLLRTARTHHKGCSSHGGVRVTVPYGDEQWVLCFPFFMHGGCPPASITQRGPGRGHESIPGEPKSKTETRVYPTIEKNLSKFWSGHRE